MIPESEPSKTEIPDSSAHCNSEASLENTVEGRPAMKKRTMITIETDRIISVYQSKTNPLGWCADCARRVPLVTVDDAARISRTSSRTIFQWVEARRLHFTETPDGRLLICLDSLS